MIGDVLVYLKTCLNTYFTYGQDVKTAQEDPVVFLSGAKMDPLSFTANRVSALLINIEQNNLLRRPDPYLQIAANGTQQRVHPEIRLSLYVLFVANHTDYEDSLRSLSRIIKYFQTRRVITHQTNPDLPPTIEKLMIELITLPFAEQNEVWNSLRVTYHPSVLYKVQMVVFSDDQPEETPEIVETDVHL